MEVNTRHCSYDDGYRRCPCFWGTKPSKLVREAANYFDGLIGLRALDIGCGEGKNAYYLATLGIQVEAIDSSTLAIERAKVLWPALPNLSWRTGNILEVDLTSKHYEIVIATGSLHCLGDHRDIETVINLMQSISMPNGINVISAFNDRQQDLSGHHEHFVPCLMHHQYYVDVYRHWKILHESDRDLQDMHPHNGIVHCHSITRLMAIKV